MAARSAPRAGAGAESAGRERGKRREAGRRHARQSELASLSRRRRVIEITPPPKPTRIRPPNTRVGPAGAPRSWRELTRVYTRSKGASVEAAAKIISPSTWLRGE